MVQMAPPCGRVLTGPKTLGLSRAQDFLDASAHPARGLGDLLPDRREDSENSGSVDFVDGPVTERRGIDGERRRPLLAVLLVSEAGRKIGGDRISERAELRDRGGCPPAHGDRVDARLDQPASIKRLLAGLGEPDFGEAAESVFMRPPRHHVAQEPLLCASRRYGQLKAAPVAILARLRRLDFPNRQLVHALSPKTGSNQPTRMNEMRADNLGHFKTADAELV